MEQDTSGFSHLRPPVPAGRTPPHRTSAFDRYGGHTHPHTQMPAVLQTANTPITLFSNAALSLRPALIGTGSTAVFSWKSILVAVGKLSAAHRADL